MFFKNAIILKLTEQFHLNAEELEQKLLEFSFKPCGKTDAISVGWSPALHPKASAMVHASGDFFMICLKRQEKVLPAAAIRELLDEKIAELEEIEDRKVMGKEKLNLKEELIQMLLPTALTKSSYTHAFIDTKNNYVVVNTSAHSKSEELTAYLRKCLGSLPVVPLEPEAHEMFIFTDWVRGDYPADVTLGTEVRLKDFSEDEGIVTCKNLALDANDIQGHLDCGRHVIQLEIDWDETLSCVLTENLVLKRIRFSDVLKEQNEDITDDDQLARLDADFTLMAGELTRFIKRLVDLFGVKESS
ncbi:recombination-associated protein RdgC [Catenovulum sediminis]|uniref:Recombination-associated protein RdgC n=1 Tax=Catenovulum sediminis TaxID=1740262 RepID=A0ABV1RHB2_9ALTE